MSDLVIRKDDGWVDISEAALELPDEVQRELWGYLGKGESKKAAALLDMEIGDLLEDEIGTADIAGIRAVLEPDDILGERLRVWIRT